MIADPDTCFQELISEDVLIFIAGSAVSGINYRFQQFSGGQFSSEFFSGNSGP